MALMSLQYPPIYPKWMPDQREYAIEQERYRHDEAMAFFGEYSLFVMMWRHEDYVAGRVNRCPDCFVGYGKIAETYQQAAREKCPTCYGTTYEGGWQAQLVRLALWDMLEPQDKDEQRRGEFDVQTAIVQTTSDFRLRVHDFIFRADGTRWQMQVVSTNHLREGFEMPNHVETPLGYHFGTVVKEDQSSVAYMMEPTPEVLASLDVTNVRYPPDWSGIEQIRGVTPEDEVTTLSTQPEVLDLDIYGGDTFSLRLNFTNQATGQPWPLAGTWAAQVRSGGEIVTAFAIDVSQQAQGTLVASLTGEQTAELAAHPDPQLQWDLQQTDAGQIKTWYRGSIQTTHDVTT